LTLGVITFHNGHVSKGDFIGEDVLKQNKFYTNKNISHRMKSKTNQLRRKQERSCFAPTPVEFPSSSDPGREQSRVVPQGLGTLANPILGIINSVRQKSSMNTFLDGK